MYTLSLRLPARTVVCPHLHFIVLPLLCIAYLGFPRCVAMACFVGSYFRLDHVSFGEAAPEQGVTATEAELEQEHLSSGIVICTRV